MNRNASEPTQVQLAHGVRYRWDEVREQHQLLYPEGLLVLNETGAAIAQLCDGRSQNEIRRELSYSFPETDLERDVDEFLERLVKRGLVNYGGPR